jgi:phosphatidylethanolamine-binding protein (PEBP) family uncharacterized protein
MEVIYNNSKPIKNDEFLQIIKTQKKPEIKFDFNKSKKYLLIMYDPDAVSGTYIHWIISNINDSNMNNWIELIPYKGPAPPLKSGKHRYIFELYEQKLINLNPIKERNMSISNLRKLLGVNEPINKIQFISQSETGGKKNRKTNKRRNNKKRKTKKKH